MTRPSPLLTPADAAEYLAIKPRTLKELRRRGEVPATKVGASVRYRLSVLDRYIERRTEEAAS